VITDLKTDMDLIKERLLDMRQIKELLLEFKKGKTPSDGGENSVNRDKKAEENSDNNGSREDSEEEEPNYHSYKISISELKHGRLKSSKNILEVKREESMEEEQPSKIKIKKTIEGIKEAKQMLQLLIEKRGISLEFEKEDKQSM